MNKRTVARLIKDVEKQKERIGRERDKLRDLTSELESILEDCDDAVANLEAAADAMSKYL